MSLCSTRGLLFILYSKLFKITIYVGILFDFPKTLQNNTLLKAIINGCSYGSTGSPNVGTKFRLLMVAVTAIPKVGRKLHNIFNSIMRSNK